MKFTTHKVIGRGVGAHDQSWDILEGPVWGPWPSREFFKHVPEAAWREVSPYFTPRELACKGTGALLVHVPMLHAYNELRRERLLTAHTPNSWYRAPAHNKTVGGSKRSRHMFSAVDVPRRAIPDVPALLTRAAELGFNGFGTYSTFIHMDWRARPAFWPAHRRRHFPNW